MNLDITASFFDVTQPTPFGIYDSDLNFRTDADGMVRYVYTKLGGRTLGIEMHNKDVYASLEEAVLEYSAMVNSYQAKSVISNILGSATTSTLEDGKLPRFGLGQAVKEADAYSSEALVGGSRTLYSSSIQMHQGQQKYDLQALLSGSGAILPTDRIQLEQVFHFSPTSAYRFFDTASSLNYLNNEFHFESFTPESIFYMLPVWEDVLRAQEMKMSQKVRRSNYSWNNINNILTIFPSPQLNIPVYFTYYLVGEDPWKNQPANVVTNISNVPFGNLSYSSVNALGHQWIRRFALSLAKEVLGQVRSKVTDIPIPDGTLTLNGPALVMEAREEQNLLREDLKVLLESMTYSSLSVQEMNQAESLQKQLSKVPMLIFVG